MKDFMRKIGGLMEIGGVKKRYSIFDYIWIISFLKFNRIGKAAG